MPKNESIFPDWIIFKKRRYRILGIISLILLIVVGAGTYYLQTRKNKIAGIILELIDKNYTGHIAYDNVTLDTWSTLSAPSIFFENLVVTDTSSTNHLRLRAEELKLQLSIEDLFEGKIQIKSGSLAGASLFLDNYTPLTPEEQKGLPPVPDSPGSSTKIKNTFLEKNTHLDISDLHLRIRHHVKNKRFEFQINEIAADLEFTEKSISAVTDIDLDIEALGFNLDKGTFVNGANASGKIDFVFDRTRKEMSIAPFPLELGDQVFNTSATLNFMDVGTFDIVLENQNTRFASTLGLLTEHIAGKFENFTLERPLQTRAKLEGGFYYKNNPRVQVDFKTVDNSAVIAKGKILTDLNFSGEFVNRVYTDERKEQEDPKNFRIQIPELTGLFKDIEIQIEALELASSPDAENVFAASINARGSAESLNDFVLGQHWNFQGGQLELTSQIDGKRLDMGSILSEGNTQLTLEDTRIINNQIGVSLPIKEASLNVERDRAVLEELKIEVGPRDHLGIRAWFANFSSLFGYKPKSAAQSKLSIFSENLVWEDFIELFDNVSAVEETQKPETVLQDLLKDIQQKYDPNIDIALGKFHVGSFLLTDLRSGLHFDNEHLLSVEKTSFGIQGGKMEMEGSLDLAHGNSIPLYASLKGTADIAILNQLLDEDQLNLDGGRFHFNADLSGDLLHPDEILGISESSFKISDFNATYVPGKITFPVKSLELELVKDQAKLNDLTLHLGEEDEVTFTGDIENLSTLLFGGSRKKVHSELYIASEKLTWEDFVQLFEGRDSQQSKSTQKDSEGLIASERKLKASLRDIQAGLNPHITAEIKEFRYGDMKGFHDLSTGISFRDGQTLKLEETSFQYNAKTAVELSAEIDISDAPKTYIDTRFEASGDPEELNDIFNNDTFLFRGGTFQVNAQIRGDIGALDSLIADSDSEFKIKDTFIEYKPSKVYLPIAALDVGLHNNTAKLNLLKLELESGDEVFLKGEVGYISDLIFGLPPGETRTYSTLTLNSAKLNFEEFRSLFSISQGDLLEVKGESALRPTIRDVYNKFRPSLSVSIDEFELNGLEVSNLKSGFYIEDENRIYLEKSVFDFHNGSVSLDAHLDISEAEKTFFSFGLVSDSIPLDRLLAVFDYFDLPSLRSATDINGRISLDAEIEGEANTDRRIIPESLAGTINFDLEEARVVGFEPLIESGGLIFKKERLQDIRFKPLQNSMILSDKILDIPLMEIQSSAFQLFVAGQLGFGDEATNLWIGFPLRNLKSRDVRNVPDKKGFIASGKKVYVEAKSDEKKGMKYVLHLTPKKFYKEREMMENYRKEIREERKQIRQYKRKKSSKSNR